MAEALICDSHRERHALFQRGIRGHTVLFAESAATSIYQLSVRTPGIIFLDYEFGIPGVSASTMGNGALVAAWMSEHPKWDASTVVVYDTDPWGAERLLSILKKNNIKVLYRPEIWRSHTALSAVVNGVSPLY